MTYLLEVNVLVALGLLEHSLNDRIADWIKQENYPSVATCPITELVLSGCCHRLPHTD